LLKAISPKLDSCHQRPLHAHRLLKKMSTPSPGGDATPTRTSLGGGMEKAFHGLPAPASAQSAESLVAQAQKAVASNEREVEFAELEMRIRKYNLDLLQPTIRKTTLMEQVVEELREQVLKTSSTVGDLSRTSSKVDQQVIVVENFREEMARWDAERRQAQAQAAESLSVMKQDLDTFRYALEREDSSIHSIQRTVDRAVDEIQKVQAGADSLQHHVNSRIVQQNKLLNGTKADLEVRLISLETRHNRLSDELWGEATGLTKVTRDLSKTDETVAYISRELVRMEHEKAHVTQLEAVQGEVNRGIGETNANVSTLKKTLDTMLHDVKEHFRTATNTVAAHSATMLSEVRSAYQEDLTRSAKLRTDCTSFMTDARSDIGRLEDTIGKTSGMMEAKVGKIQSDVEEVGKLRKRDRGNTEVEQKMLHEHVLNARGSSESMAKCLEHLSSVISIMLESERASVALYAQDDVDRAKVALVGYRDSKKGTGSSSSTRPPSSGRNSSSPPLPPVGQSQTPRGKSATSPSPDQGGPPKAGDDSSAPVISVDQRCLSCSGQGQAVLSGFKMACLQYAPGPVTFAKKTYARADLLDLREKLLDQAKEALMSGPVKISNIEQAPSHIGSQQQQHHVSDHEAQGRSQLHNSSSPGPDSASPPPDAGGAYRSSTTKTTGVNRPIANLGAATQLLTAR